MEEKIKLEVIEYLIDNDYERGDDVPTKFRGRITEENMRRLSKEVGDLTDTKKLLMYKDKLERAIQDRKILELQERTLELEEKSFHLSKITGRTQYLIVFITLLGVFTSYYVIVAKPIGPGFRCPTSLNEGSSLTLQFGNYGDVPTNMYFEWKGNNIIGQSNWWQEGFMNSFTQRIILPPLKYVKDFEQTKYIIDMIVVDVNKTYANFTIKWWNDDPISMLSTPLLSCNYRNENGTFIIV